MGGDGSERALGATATNKPKLNNDEDVFVDDSAEYTKRVGNFRVIYVQQRWGPEIRRSLQHLFPTQMEVLQMRREGIKDSMCRRMR